jgi:hypothetical protein
LLISKDSEQVGPLAFFPRSGARRKNAKSASAAGAIVLFASKVILRSSKDVRDARAYLEGMRSQNARQI